MAGFTLRLPEERESRLGAEALRMGLMRSETARAAISECLERSERQRYVAAFTTEAKAAYADPRSRR